METTTKNYRYIYLTQGTDEWRDYRRSRIGSSDVASLLGVSPYQTTKELLRAKMGEEKAISAFTQKIFDEGHKIESCVRGQLQESFQVEFTNPVVESISQPRLFASLDLWSQEKELLIEVKSTGSSQVITDCLDGRIPAHYAHQMNWAMGIIGLDECRLVVVNRTDGDSCMVPNKFDSKLFAAQKLHAIKFLDELDSLKQNTSQIDPQTVKNIAITFNRIKRIQKLLDHHEDKIKNIAKDLLTASNVLMIKGSGITIEFIERKGAIEYKLIDELKGVDLEKFRKPTTTHVSIRVDKDDRDIDTI